ncbi:mechanosensitive ion channel [Alteromonas sp. ASW11-36]|uniref:Small-conductance mechanosensitive channel n=1 Tax=Alteromonas arenosi TaxID=3055817 RepID=A0ABT7SZW8_9ALTE|nr:mechanosensitive ion channel domain-containing protein [Alteromonas sp. ASW11-36]MDM7861733.1 mechanosensitive ion channel [Alteromonas sp. ASW11-36]
MTDSHLFDKLVDWVTLYQFNLIWSGVLLLGYVILTRLALPHVERKVIHSKLKSEAAAKASYMTRLIIGILTLATVLIVWGIDFSGLLLISTSLLTLTGVALFASWSLLSNVTSYFVLLFQPSFRRGNFIRIIDGDNYIQGYIADVNLFSAKLITESREEIVYPNNLLLTRPTIVNPRDRDNSIGKTASAAPVAPVANSVEDSRPAS